MTTPSETRTYTGPQRQQVQQMFSSIAHRYDLLNRVLSVSIDRRWRRKAVELVGSKSPGPGDRCLDLCTGTGDLAIELADRLGIETIGSDFCHPMLTESVRKLRARGGDTPVRLVEADALALPFPSEYFRFVTVAFGIRNVESLDAALGEMRRVLKPGGMAVILEFSRPQAPVFSRLFDWYFSRILPGIGAFVSGVRGPYQYLPASVSRFPAQDEFAGLIRTAGFERVEFRNLTGGVAALHWGFRQSDSGESAARG